MQRKARRRKPETSLTQLKKTLSYFGLRAKKSLGQHFLIDEEVLQQIISAAKLAPEDLVIEVGPGLGVLTRELARRAKQILAIELDAKIASALAQIIAPFPNVQIINADVLQSDPAELLAYRREESSAQGYKLVADLPYYIASPVLRHFLEALLKPSLMVVMVQKEVGEAIVAQPGEMSLLGVSVQFYGKPTILQRVSPESFYPPPKVNSVILSIVPYRQPAVQVPDVAKFFELVRAGFSSPRKQLHNSLAQGLGISPSAAVSLLEKAHIEPRRRAETLSLEEWARICRIFTQHRVAELLC